MTTITAVDVHDVRFPTAAAGRRLRRHQPGRLLGDLCGAAHRRRRWSAPGFTFTNGRGNEITCAAVRALAPPRASAAPLEEIVAEPVAFWRSLTADVQLRWLGPEKGVIHMATGALVNAVWDLRAKAGRQAAVAAAGRDAHRGAGRQRRLPPHHRRAHPGRGARPSWTRAGTGTPNGWPCSSGTASRRTPPRSGWLGYPDDKVRALTRAGVRRGLAGDEDEGRRPHRRRRAAGPDHPRRRSARTRC